MKLQGNIINKALINLDKMKKVLLTLSLSIVASMGSFAQNEPYKNPKLTPEERAEDLLGRLTLKEKIGLMKNSSFAVERLGVAPYNWWSEALHGVARNGLATVFPITMGMASTFMMKQLKECMLPLVMKDVLNSTMPIAVIAMDMETKGLLFGIRM